MTKRNIFKSIFAGLFAAKAVKGAPSKVRHQAILDGLPPYDPDVLKFVCSQDDFNKPILNIIGSGLMPPIKITHGEYRCIYVSGPSASERDVIARLIGWSGTHIIHLYGDWTSIISRETFLNCWCCNLSRNAVTPRLFVDGVEMYVISRTFCPKGTVDDMMDSFKKVKSEYFPNGYFVLPTDYESPL